VSFELEGIV